mmetsp:Transcript_20861/g.56997  ORF Transcript_20861/g.56997 Transcript_20861/m.56997 type:complete len:225 (-) Transcript_20861:792-1466(-)
MLRSWEWLTDLSQKEQYLPAWTSSTPQDLHWDVLWGAKASLQPPRLSSLTTRSSSSMAAWYLQQELGGTRKFHCIAASRTVSFFTSSSVGSRAGSASCNPMLPAPSAASLPPAASTPCASASPSSLASRCSNSPPSLKAFDRGRAGILSSKPGSVQEETSRWAAAMVGRSWGSKFASLLQSALHSSCKGRPSSQASAGMAPRLAMSMMAWFFTPASGLLHATTM